MNNLGHLSHILVVAAISGCAYYPNLDYIEYHGVDYGYKDGYPNKIYYSEAGRVTTADDKIISFSIGAKKLRQYKGDRALASSTITEETVKREGFCSNGYKIDYHPTDNTGDMGFRWMVFCE